MTVKSLITGLFWLAVIAAVFIRVFLWDNPTVIRTWYDTRFNTDATVSIDETRHHECEFMTAPIGDKHCHYERRVVVNWLALSNDTPPRPVLYTGFNPPTPCTPEKCEYPDDPLTGEHPTHYWQVTGIFVTWEKVND